MRKNSVPIRNDSAMCGKISGRSVTLVEAAERLRNYKPDFSIKIPNSSNNFKDSRINDSTTQLGPQVVQPSKAAVLICLFEGEKGDLRVILTKRSSNMSSHSGEVALPGGKWEEGDENDAYTALREANEEIGLDPSIVEVVTVLEPFYSKRKMIVFPVIGIIWDKNGFNPVLNATEVESVFDAPLEMFLKRIEDRGYEYLLHFFDYQAEKKSYTIWAFTAAILIRAASVVYQRPPAFEEHRPKFWNGSRL